MMKCPRFYVVCPPHTNSFGMGDAMAAKPYLETVRSHARWADRHGITGMVMYSFPASLDPWASASMVLECTERLRPIVTVLPFHIHPFVLTRAVASLSYMYERGLDLNIVAGASPEELTSLGQSVNSESNYRRLREYVTVIKQFLTGGADFQGDYYQISDARLRLQIAPEHRPEIFIPGSSANAAPVVRDLAESSLLTAKPLAAQREEITRLSGDRADLGHTIIVGIVARPEAQEAWDYVAEHHTDDRRSRAVSRMFIAKTISAQHRANVEMAAQQTLYDGNLWYGAAKIGIDCPKLVGGYEEVRERLAAYFAAGVTSVLLDLPDSVEEYSHIYEVIRPFMAAQ